MSSSKIRRFIMLAIHQFIFSCKQFIFRTIASHTFYFNHDSGIWRDNMKNKNQHHRLRYSGYPKMRRKQNWLSARRSRRLRRLMTFILVENRVTLGPYINSYIVISQNIHLSAFQKSKKVSQIF